MSKSLFTTVVCMAFIVLPLSTYAGGVMTEPMVDQPAYSQKKTYTFDAKEMLKSFTSKTSALQKLTCPSDILLKQAGLLGTSRKRTNVTYEDQTNNMYISFDMVNCTMNGYTINSYDSTLQLKGISEQTAIAKAKEFLATSSIKDLMGSRLGEPIITSKYSNTVPMPIDDMKPAQSAPDYIDKDEFTNITVMFPYVIDGMKVYSNYGGRLGVTVEVTEKGIVNYYGQLISIPGVIKDAKPVTNIQFINYIKRGGNNPYYGVDKTVALKSSERVYTLVQDWRNGSTTTYLATATLFSTSISQDEYAPWNMYEMIITDYRFANGNMMSYPRPMY